MPGSMERGKGGAHAVVVVLIEVCHPIAIHGLVVAKRTSLLLHGPPVHSYASSKSLLYLISHYTCLDV